MGKKEITRSDEESAVATDDPSSPLPTSSEDDYVSGADGEGRDWILGQEELVQDQSPDILEIINGLRDTMEFSQRDFVFVCGGSVPITTPVALRWDRRNDEKAASCCKLLIDGEGDGIKHGDISNLIADMRPATFGLAGEDVYDERYRKALQLEPSNFSSSFCPYTSGTVDSITQILAPGLGNGASSVRAELYKLNARRITKALPFTTLSSRLTWKVGLSRTIWFFPRTRRYTQITLPFWLPGRLSPSPSCWRESPSPSQ